MSYSLTGKIVMVTGASSGIGEACVRAFADAGAKLILAARRYERLEALAAELKVPTHLIELDVRDQAAPLINRVSAQAEAAAKRGIDAVRDSSAQLREKAQKATDTTVAYVKDEPVKSMLIAAATGALLMGLVSLMGRSRND